MAIVSPRPTGAAEGKLDVGRIADNSGAVSANPEQRQSMEIPFSAKMFYQNGLQPDWRWPWVHIGSTRRQDGWKIHLSATPDRLGALIDALVKAHQDSPFDFKVIADQGLAMMLNEGALGESQVGKCATVYPRDNQEFLDLLRRFKGFSESVGPGPKVPDDVQLGPTLFARYGGFNPVVRRDLLGQTQLLVADDTGELVPDSYSYEKTHSRFQRDFANTKWPDQIIPRKTIGPGLLTKRYLIVDTLKSTAKGSLFQALDLQAKGSPRALIIKEGRAHVLPDAQGRDICDRLKHQQKMHELAAKRGLAPACDPYFEIDGDGYLPIEFQSNDNFEIWVQQLLWARTFDAAPHGVQARILSNLIVIGRLIEDLHHIGIVHRDISPSNILVRGDETPLISDLEIAWSAGQDFVFGKGTPGFMPPEQVDGAEPAPSADIHAFAALVLYAVTGLDPRRLPRPDQSDGWTSLRKLARGLGDDLWEELSKALSPDPAKRPSLAVLRNALSISLEATNTPTPVAHPPDTAHPAPPKPVQPSTLLSTTLHAGTMALSSPALCTQPDHLWFSIPLDSNGQSGPEIRRSLNRGCAGPLYYVSQYAQQHSLSEEVTAVARSVSDWLIQNREAPDFAMPGLHFGEAGVLLALFEARAAGITDFTANDIAHLWKPILETETYWPDFTHGLAGLCVATRLFEDVLDRQKNAPAPPCNLTDQRRIWINEMLNDQNADGSWTVPAGVNGISGEIVNGFAHGVAGIAYALLTCSAGTGLEVQAQAAAERAADWLLSSANHAKDGTIHWAYSDKNPTPWTWWCHGAPGIAPLFACLFRHTGAQQYRQAALACFATIPDGFSPANLSQCHGASGIGELMLDTAELCGAPALADRAIGLAETIAARHFKGEQDVYWMVENPELASADLMVGITGILHFLLRVTSRSDDLAFPTLLPRSLLPLPNL